MHTILRVGFRHAEVDGDTIQQSLDNAGDVEFGSEVDYEFHDPDNYPPVEEIDIATVAGTEGAFLAVGLPKADHDPGYTIIAAGPLVKQDNATPRS